MNPRSRTILVAGACLGVGAVAGVGGARWWLGRSTPQTDKSAGQAAEGSEDKPPDSKALVRTVEVVEGAVHRTIEAMGFAAVPPTAISVAAWPADAVVVRIMVQPGQTIEKNAPLAQIEITPDAASQIALAEQAVAAASRALQVAQQRLERGLATRPEVVAAQSASDDARQRLERVRRGVPPADGMLRAPVSGLVGALRVQAGATVPAGAPMLEISASGTIVAQMAVETSDAHDLLIGQQFDLRPLDARDPARYKGELSVIGPAINPVSKTLDLTVAISGPDLPRPGTPLRGSLVLPDVHSMLIPRSALIPDEDGMIVFIVREGKARRAPVTVTLQTENSVAISSGCSLGDHVVVLGQGQLADGASVREEHEQTHAPGEPKGAAGGDR